MYNTQGLEQFKKYINVSSPYSPNRGDDQMRMVNQREMFEFIKLNPGVTETELQIGLYNYSRSRYEGGCFGDSNKKYADCLRRLLATGKIERTNASHPKGRFMYYVSVTAWEVDPKHPSTNFYQIVSEEEIEATIKNAKKPTITVVDKPTSYNPVHTVGEETPFEEGVDFNLLSRSFDGKLYLTKSDIAKMAGVDIKDLIILS